jgi:phosphocarrier protein HPr
MPKKITRSFTIINQKGLHARASAKFVETVELYDASAEIWKDGLNACGDSIMGLLMLAASQGTSIDVVIEGAQSLELADALQQLIGNSFGENH